MNITFQMEGGIAHFPGLQRPVSIDVAALPEPQSSELVELLEALNFFQLPGQPDKHAKPDCRSYVVTVSTSQQAHTVVFTDPVDDSRAQRLIALLREQVRKQA
jgi:hypothetical protein